MATRDASAPSIADAAPPRSRIGPLARLAARLESLAEAERDQLPLWLPVGLILGISAYFYLPDHEAWIAFLLLAASSNHQKRAEDASATIEGLNPI